MKNITTSLPNKPIKFIAAIVILLFNSVAHAQNPNIGFGTTSPGTKATVIGSFAASYKSIDADVTLNGTDFFLAVNSTANRTITLPASIAGVGNFLGRTYHIKNTGTFAVTIAASGAELIDNQSGVGIANVVLPEGYYCTIISKGTTAGGTWESILMPGGTTGPQYVNCNGTPGNFPAAFTSVAQLYTPWIVSSSKGITVSGGYIQLTPGYTYKLECTLYGRFGSSGNILNFRWVDGSNTVIPTTCNAQSIAMNNPIHQSSAANLALIYTATPGNGSKIGVWLSAAVGTFVVVGDQSSMSAIQMK